MIDQTEAEILDRALAIAERRMAYTGNLLHSPDDVKRYLKVWAARLTEEAFGVIWLTSEHRCIAAETLFYGTIDGTNIHPRAVIRKALECNASAAIVFHNHPSGNADPSDADLRITERLAEALKLIDVRLLDSMVVGRNVVSMAERGHLFFGRS